MAPDDAPTLRVLVDESGDPGTRGKGTRWLVLVAAETGAPGGLLSSIEAINVQRGRTADALLHFAHIRSDASSSPHVNKWTVEGIQVAPLLWHPGA